MNIVFDLASHALYIVRKMYTVLVERLVSSTVAHWPAIDKFLERLHPLTESLGILLRQFSQLSLLSVKHMVVQK